MSQTTVSLSEAAKMLGVPYLKLYRAVQRGDLESQMTKTIFDKKATIRIPLEVVKSKQLEMQSQAS